MISLTCTSCKKVLQIDDAFAGGVCRCKFCGTIQTVPSKTRAASPTAATVPPKAAPPPKTLFQSSAHAPPTHHTTTSSSGTGLEELAQIVASSGLAGTGLRSSHLRKPSAQKSPAATNLKPILLVGGGILAVLIAVFITWLLMRGKQSESEATTGPGISSPNVAPNAQQPQSPNYMGLPLTGPSVIYLLDRGSGTLETFDYLKRGAIKSIASLGPGAKFQIIFWETDSLIEFPEGAMRYATTENAAATEEAIKDVYAFQQSKIEKPLEKALAQNPAEIVIVTGKYGLDDEFVSSVLSLRKTSPVKIHTLSLGKSGSPDALRKLAEKTGAHFKEVSGQALAEYAN
ncbi:MAG TPA: hypothetical protein VGQ99_10930 [Tepidisphaeraceae bacterium]|jgi:RNA-binding protein YhbY|nr:hypothetical protein [Tepidisphaeraceae bacterium]